MSDTIYAERDLETDMNDRVDQLAWRLLKVTTLTGEVSVWTKDQSKKVLKQARSEGLMKQVRVRVRDLRQNVRRELMTG